MIRVVVFWWFIGSVVGVAAGAGLTELALHLHYIGPHSLAVPSIIGLLCGLIGSQTGLAVGRSRERVARLAMYR